MEQTLANVFLTRVREEADIAALKHKENKGYQSITWKEFGETVDDIAYGLAECGVAHGSCVGIFSQNSPQWVAADLGTMLNGGISVPLYPTTSQADLEFILQNSEAKAVFVQNESMTRRILTCISELPCLVKIVCIKTSSGRPFDEVCQQKDLQEARESGLLVHLDELRANGAHFRNENPGLMASRVAALKSADTATVIYTSGTTGTPKGAAISHANITAIVNAIRPTIPITKAEVYLSYLPLSHVFERICGEFYWMHDGGIYAFAESIETMAKNLGEVEPTMLLVVPRVLDRIYAKVRSGIEGASGRARKLIDWSLEVGKEVLRDGAQNKPIRPMLRLKHAIAEKLVFAKLRQRIGAKLRLVVSGGAPATPTVLEFFNAIGIGTLEGYGLTETCASASVNPPGHVRIGTVGPALTSVEIKLAEDGEIMLKGPTIVQEYYKNPEATAEAFEDGWFKTGDIGTIDGDGYIAITDRKKDLIVNSSGKNIAPQRIEAMLKTVPFVSQAIVFGDKQKSLVALMTLDEMAATEYAREHGWEFQTYAELASSVKLHAYIRKEIALRSGKLADYEKVKRFCILPEDLSIANGELTATMKVKRNVVAKLHKVAIDALYVENSVAVG